MGVNGSRAYVLEWLPPYRIFFSRNAMISESLLPGTPHGGDQMTLHPGGGLGGCEAYRGMFGIFAGLADDAKVENGFLQQHDRRGIGLGARNQLYAVMKELVK